ncbi:MAG: SusC/RagA family TonB-linked outer membrane protein, partial [Bacteroidales bacterium]
MMHFVFSHRKALLTTSISVVTSIGAFAQDVTVKGIVKDASGIPVTGANIVEKGTTNGVISDIDGKFELKVKQGTPLIVSFIGYIPQEFTASSGKPMVIILQENTVDLKETVVIGYGTVKKSDATGSVVSIKADQLNKGVVSNPIEMLQGKTPGVQINNNGGAPGEGATIRIRGGSSMSASNDPLIVIDGLPIGSTSISGMKNPLSTINPNDIESFTVLKDASATAIYGSRASNGVILITTKKGTQDKVQVNADVAFSVAYLQDKVDVLDGAGLRNVVEKVNGIEHASYKALGYTNTAGERVYANTDWLDQIYRTAFSEEANISVNGAVKQAGILTSMPYRVSGGFINQDGILKTSNMKKGTASFNLTPTLFDDYLRLNLSGKGMYIHNRFANQDAVGEAVRHDPTKPIYSNVAGESLNGYSAWMSSETETNNMAGMNPLAMLYDKVDKSNVYRFIGSAQIDYKFHFLPTMRATVNLGLDYSDSKGTVETPTGSEISKHDKLQLGSGLYKDYKQTRRDETLEAYLAYNPNLDAIQSKFDILGGYSWQHFWRSEHNKEVKNNNREEILYEKPFKTENYLVSFFGRINYSFKDRYFLTATVREDGSSRFQNNKWGFFPSAAFAWRVINENFMSESAPVLSDLKLRLGYGKTGQQEVGSDYGSFATYKNHLPGSYYMFGDQLIYPLTPLGYSANLKWEETVTYNIGLDYGFWNNRITGTLDLYYRKTNDLLNIVPEASGTNLKNYILKNVGNLENKGVEAGINVIAIDKKDWTWNFGFNYTWNKNKITKLTANSDPDYVGEQTGGIAGGVGNNIQIMQVGQPVNSFYVYQQVYDKTGKPIEGEYVDRNADGIINDKDRYVYHKAAPDVYLGFNTDLRYNKWTLSVAARAA